MQARERVGRAGRAGAGVGERIEGLVRVWKH